MTSINTLEEWHKNALSISSPYLIKAIVSREKISFIYNELKNGFGEKFFRLKIGIDTPLDKTIWINQLLANKNHLGSIGALYHIALLIQYANTLEANIINDIKRLKNNPRNLRTFFYELFIFNILDRSNIPNQKKIVIGDQEIEGICTINGKQFLFECRKVFMPRIEDLDIKKRLMEVFYLKSKTMNKGIGIICGIRMTRPIISSYRQSFEEKISTFFENFNKSDGFNKINYVIEDETGLFNAINYDEASLIEAKGLKKYDVLFYLSPTGNKGNMVHLVGGTQGVFEVTQTALYKKLENILKEKKKQHKNSIYKHKIIFIDTEIFPGLELDLFQTETSFDEEMLKNVYNKVCRDTILIITRRIYQKETPEIKVAAIYTKALESEANYLLSNFN
ncbi:hypothetical protein [Hymenobacter defluvii]|uniref:Piwi domain-containing protein n=1 Tax=Hymenobacter defluvii TaxID=2054411 RepID=A0ABS3TAU2_9BACT|nr:hypothetical protein [Hymenobacter defluvii]MBO3270458.1 hypothetical protein [Hymenobacter defluvii]